MRVQTTSIHIIILIVKAYMNESRLGKLGDKDGMKSERSW